MVVKIGSWVIGRKVNVRSIVMSDLCFFVNLWVRSVYGVERYLVFGWCWNLGCYLVDG